MDPMQPGAAPLPEEEARRQLRRAVIASTVGTTIEWYDFFLYGTAAALVGLWRRSEPLAFGGSSVGTLGIISTVGLSMFPFILPSSIDPQSSLTAWNASSSHVTLFIMLVVTIIFLPLILLYTSWVYKVLWGRSTTAALRTNPDLY